MTRPQIIRAGMCAQPQFHLVQFRLKIPPSCGHTPLVDTSVAGFWASRWWFRVSLFVGGWTVFSNSHPFTQTPLISKTETRRRPKYALNLPPADCWRHTRPRRFAKLRQKRQRKTSAARAFRGLTATPTISKNTPTTSLPVLSTPLTETRAPRRAR